jgi:hypothetical protein
MTPYIAGAIFLPFGIAAWLISAVYRKLTGLGPPGVAKT